MIITLELEEGASAQGDRWKFSPKRPSMVEIAESSSHNLHLRLGSDFGCSNSIALQVKPSHAKEKLFSEITVSSCGQNERGKYFDATRGFSHEIFLSGKQTLCNFLFYSFFLGTKKKQRIQWQLKWHKNINFPVIRETKSSFYDHQKIFCVSIPYVTFPNSASLIKLHKY